MVNEHPVIEAALDRLCQYFNPWGPTNFQFLSLIHIYMSDVTFDMADNRMEVHQRKAEPWRVTLVDTGETTMTGGRLKRVADYVKAEEAFCCLLYPSRCV